MGLNLKSRNAHDRTLQTPAPRKAARALVAELARA
jgi:hypothetical protein